MGATSARREGCGARGAYDITNRSERADALLDPRQVDRQTDLLGEHAVRLGVAGDAGLGPVVGKWDESVKLGERAVEIAPASAEAWLWLGRSYGQKARNAAALFGLGPAKKAKAAFEKVLALDPANLEGRSHLVEYHVQAPGIAGGDKDEAARLAGELVKLDPVRGHLAWASIHREAEDLAAVERDLRAAGAADPAGKYDGKLNLAGFLIHHKRFDEARGVWQEALRADPENRLARYQLGRVSSFSGDRLDEAVGHFEAYMAGGKPEPGWPSLADAAWRLGLIQEKAGRRPEAEAAFRRALAFDPKHARSKAELELERLGVES